MLRVLAVVQRDLLKYFRNPSLLGISLALPIFQLLVIGYAIGGKIRDLPVALVDLDKGAEALRLRGKLDAVARGPRTFRIVAEADLDAATRKTRNGDFAAAIVIPQDYSRKALQGRAPRVGLILDNTDLFVSMTLSESLRAILDSETPPPVASLDLVELFPFVEYIQYMLPAAIAAAIYISCVIGGGLLYVDDKAQGIHEGYLATPITTIELLSGMVIAGAIKAVLVGVFITICGSLIAGVAQRLSLAGVLLTTGFIALFSVAMVTLVSALTVRVRDPLVARGIFSILNLLLFFPSGALYPVASFPAWLKAISVIDPFTYAVHGLRATLLKQAPAAALETDALVLALFSTACFLFAWMLFPRRV